MTHAENNGPWRSLLLRLLVTGIVLALWFWTQSLIGARTTPGPGIRDGLHNFSGHTAIAVFAAIELSRLRRNWLTAAAILLAVFEVATVLILRAHYTMDAFTGVVAAFWVADLSSRISPRLDQLITAKP